MYETVPLSAPRGYATERSTLSTFAVPAVVTFGLTVLYISATYNPRQADAGLWTAPAVVAETVAPSYIQADSRQIKRIVQSRRSAAGPTNAPVYETAPVAAQQPSVNIHEQPTPITGTLAAALLGMFAGLTTLYKLLTHTPTSTPQQRLEGLSWGMASTAGTGTWEEFTAAASGDWEGFLVDCTPEGTPKELPHYVVPEALKEWGQELFDWQLRSRMRPDGDTLSFVQERYYPTAGCEVDATTIYDTQPKDICKSDPGLIFSADGSFSQGPADLPNDAEPVYLNFCMVDSAEKSRIRMEIKVAAFKVKRATAVMEYYEGPYDPNASLPTSCGGTHEALTAIPPLTAEQFKVDMANLDDTVPLQEIIQLPGGISCITQTNSTGGWSVQVQWGGQTYTRTWSAAGKFVDGRTA